MITPGCLWGRDLQGVGGGCHSCRQLTANKNTKAGQPRPCGEISKPLGKRKDNKPENEVESWKVLQ